MGRNTRNTVILAKAETTYGVDASPTGSDAVLVSNPSSKLGTNNARRGFVRPYFGASEELVGTKWRDMAFNCELVGSGTAGTAPQWAPLVKACGFQEILETGVRADYAPLTDEQPSVTLYAFMAGARQKALGARGKLTLGMKQGEIPELRFAFTGLDGGIAVANPSGVDFGGWQTPQVVTNANSTVLNLGGTVNLDDDVPVVTGGVGYPSLGLELDLGIEVPFTPLVGGESVDVTERQVSGRITLDLTATQEVAMEGGVIANTLTSIAFLHGTVAGKKVLVYLPRVQLINPADEDLNGRLLKSYDIVGVPNASGNDELRIITF